MKSDLNLFETRDSIFLKKVFSKADLQKDDSCDGYLIESSEREARRIIESLKGSGKVIALVGQDDSFNRRAIETLKIDYLVSPEGRAKFNTLKQRDSGLNHVVAKEAVKRDICIVVGVFDLSGLDSLDRVRRLEKIIQNVKICRKVGCSIKIASLAEDKSGLVDLKGRQSIGVSLGMDSGQSCYSVSF